MSKSTKIALTRFGDYSDDMSVAEMNMRWSLAVFVLCMTMCQWLKWIWDEVWQCFCYAWRYVSGWNEYEMKFGSVCVMQSRRVDNPGHVAVAVGDQPRIRCTWHAGRPQRANVLPVSSSIVRRDDWLRQPGRTCFPLLTYELVYLSGNWQRNTNIFNLKGRKTQQL